MARIPRGVSGGVIYHVINRANGKERIFQKEKDYSIFEKILLEAKEKYKMRILSFCIMPNHWHLVLYPRTGEALSQFMRWVTLTHTQRLHTHYHSIGSGHVYQGRFKSFPVQEDTYFLQVCRYVERNPVRAGLAKKIDEWRWSSAWIRSKGTLEQQKLLDPWPVAMPQSYTAWANALSLDEEEKLEKIRHSLKRGCPFGENEWVTTMAMECGLESTLLGRGRPKKGT